MRDWWMPGSADGALGIASLFLVLGGLFGGATVAGAEWRAGTVTTLLTWEPRRLRVHLSRCAACAVLAAVISFALQAVFLASLLPAVLATRLDGRPRSHVVVRAARGDGAHVSLRPWRRSSGARCRRSVATPRSHSWLRSVDRGLRGPGAGTAARVSTELLWAENTGTVLQWSQLENVEFRRGPVVALVTVVLYVALVVAAATMSFTRRDIASAS